MKFKCNHTGVAGEGLEVNGRVKNGHFERVNFSLVRPLSIISYCNSDNLYIYFSSTITYYYYYIIMVRCYRRAESREGDFGKLKYVIILP